MGRLKSELSKSWNVITEVMSLMFDFRGSRGFRTLIRTAQNKLNVLTNEEVPSFLDAFVDLALVGPLCSSLGVNRHKLLDPTLLKDCDSDIFGIHQLKVGVLFELDDFRKLEKIDLEHVCTWLQVLGKLSSAPPQDKVKDILGELRSEFKSLNKSKARKGDLLDELLRRDIGAQFDLEVIPPTCSSPNESDTEAVGLHSASDLDVSTGDPGSGKNEELESNKSEIVEHSGDLMSPQKRGALIKSLKGELEGKNVLIGELKTKLDALAEHSKHLSGQVSELNTTNREKDAELSELKARYFHLKTNLSKKEKDLSDSQQNLVELKSSGVYQRSLKKLSELQEQEQKLEKKLAYQRSVNDMKEQIAPLREKITSLQNLVSKYKLQNKTNADRVTEEKKERKALKAELVTLEAELLHYRSPDSFQTREDVNNRFTDELELCAMELSGECEVASARVRKVIQCVSKWLHGQNIKDGDLPSASTVCNFVDRAHVLAKLQVAEECSESKCWDLHSDGTSRDHNKIIGKQITLESGQTRSVGFTPVAVEDSASLLDNVIAMIDELSELYSDCSKNEKDTVFRNFLEKMFAVMSDRCSVNKAFNRQLSEYKTNFLGNEVDTHFLFCNAHFLLGLSTAVEAKLKDIEKDLVAALGHGLGRDANPKFRTFKNASGSAACRFVRLTCDVLGPRGDEKNGCRLKWLSFLVRLESASRSVGRSAFFRLPSFLEENLQKKSKVTSFRMNRFNNFFLGAATLFHHSSDMILFFEHFEQLNLKLESVQIDNTSPEILALARALGILYYKVSGPFWLMLQGDVEYVDQYQYIQEMLAKFKQWEADSTSLMSRDQNGIFGAQFFPPRDEVYESLFSDMHSSESDLTKSALEKLMTACIMVTERQLVDFLPGGRYSSPATEEQRISMKHCKLTNLVSEWEFGDLIFGMYKRRNASLFGSP
ncbi:uncharacterized protein LOC135484780 [Lineus longissimus]|uniref:uncharacterized protein LOC135484780 n=1 Tax=Lineus longissimus TaxID=88925 RepID=UPI00315DB6BD